MLLGKGTQDPLATDAAAVVVVGCLDTETGPKARVFFSGGLLLLHIARIYIECY